jgi:hypothetical protein
MESAKYVKEKKIGLYDGKRFYVPETLSGAQTPLPNFKVPFIEILSVKEKE